MNSKLFKLITLGLLLIMMVPLAGCTDGDDGEIDSDGPEEEVSDDPGAVVDEEVEGLYGELAGLEGEEALAFFESLGDRGLSDDEILDFFINIPLSNANEQIKEIYEDEGFEMYAESYPMGEAYQGFTWEKGSGTQITGPFSGNDLKLPFTDYIPLDEGPVGDPEQEYKIGVVFHGFSHSWLINWADAAKWQADQHPNVEADVLDAEFDNNTMASMIDTFIAQDVDGILVWPMVEAATGPPVRRAIEAGIPTVTVDRLADYDGVTSRVTGNFPANGAQCGMYLIWKLANEGDLSANIVMLRKPLGSTADAVRTGHFLKVLSYFPGIEMLESYHDADSREDAFVNAQSALTAYSDIDVFFGTGDHQALAALEATLMANRLESRDDGNKIIFLSIDDSKEAITKVEEGDFEVNTPYTPLISDIGMRVLLNVLTGKDMPQDVITPNIPMVTQQGDVIFGMQTQAPDEWFEYTFGPPMR